MDHCTIRGGISARLNSWEPLKLASRNAPSLRPRRLSLHVPEPVTHRLGTLLLHESLVRRRELRVAVELLCTRSGGDGEEATPGFCSEWPEGIPGNQRADTERRTKKTSTHRWPSRMGCPSPRESSQASPQRLQTCSRSVESGRTEERRRSLRDGEVERKKIREQKQAH